MSVTPIGRYDGVQVAGAQVRVTADRVRRWQFGGASFTRRGYDHADVDRFRMQVADELDLLSTQIANLRAENERLTDRVELHRHGVIPSAEPTSPLPAAKEVNLLSAAQREAEQIVAQAHDYARRVAEYARVQYDGYLRAAAEEAKQEAERAVAEYRAGGNADDSAATREALLIFGEMMISHMRAAARHLDDGSEQLARTMERIARQAGDGSVGSGQPQVALPRHQQR
ncbi:MAG: cell division protein DivIVA [Micromonospora sp.]